MCIRDRLDSRTLALLREFLALEVDLAAAPQALAAFAEKAGLVLGEALVRFESRVTALREAGVDPAGITYRAAFGLPRHWEDESSAVYNFGNTLINVLVSSQAPELIEPCLLYTSRCV